jgi:hypothetical protein
LPAESSLLAPHPILPFVDESTLKVYWVRRGKMTDDEELQKL